MQEEVKLQPQVSVQERIDPGIRQKLKSWIKISEINYKLTLIKGEIYRYLSSMMIFDDKNNILYNSRIASESGVEILIEGPKMVFELPPGNYTLRITVDGQFTDTLVKLDKDKTCVIGKIEQWLRPRTIHHHIKPPQLFSSVPLNGNIQYSSTFDYYVEAAEAISVIDTFKTKNNEIDSGLFIFFRYPNADIFRDKFKSKACWSKFKLYNSKNQILTAFPNGTSASNDFNLTYDESLGYLGFSAKLPPGQYFIKYDGRDKRTVPLYVYQKWYTQVFMMMEEEPLFGTLKVLLDYNRQFDSKNILHSYIDVCLSKLQNRDYTLDRDLVRLVAERKFDSPVLGILGAYIYLMGSATSDDNLFRTIVRNLQEKILADSSNSQDIYALNFLSYEHFGRTLNSDVKRNVEGTPMFRVAYDVIRKAASVHEWVIPANSLNDKVAENQYFDSAFNTYKTITKKKFKVAGREEEKGDADLREIREYLPNLKEIYEWQLENFTREEYSLQALLDDSRNYIRQIMEPSEEYLDLKFDENLSPLVLTEEEWDNLVDKKWKDIRNAPNQIGRVGMQIASFMFENNNNISDREIAKGLNLPISTVIRIRNDFKI